MAAKRRVRNALRVYVRTTAAGEGWWWVGVPGGKRHTLGLREADVSREEAHRVACERFAQSALGPGKTGAPAEEGLDVVIEKYVAEEGPRWKDRSREGFELMLAAFHEAMAELDVPRVSLITSEVLATYIKGRQAKVENATVNRTLMLVRRMVRWARRRKPTLLPVAVYLEDIKALKEIEREASPLIPSPLEWKQVIGHLARGVLPIVYPNAERYLVRHAANARGAALLVATAVQTGERLDELRHMRLDDIGTDEIRVAAWGDWSPKNHRNRTIPVPTSTAVLAKEFAAWRDRAVGLNGQLLVLGEHWISEQLDAAWEKAGFPGDAPRMHDCRRTFATELHRSGQPLTLVRDRMGHGDVETTEGYLGRYRSDRARVVPDMGVGAALLGTG